MAISLELAISAIRAGRKEEGRQLLNLLIQQNPNDERAWLWMSSVVTTEEQKARCLYHVLAIDPDNALARKGLQLLGVTVTDSRPVKIPALQTQRLVHPAPVPHTLPENGQPIVLRPAAMQPQVAPPPVTGNATPPDSDPVPRSQPVVEAEAAPAESEPDNDLDRRPFLISPETITQELPFTPVHASQSAVQSSAEAAGPPPAQPIPEVKASPAILHMNLDEILDDDGAAAEADSDSEGSAPSETVITSPTDPPGDEEPAVDSAAGSQPVADVDSPAQPSEHGSNVAPPTQPSTGQVPHETRPTPATPGFDPNLPPIGPSTVFPPYAQHPMSQGYGQPYGQPPLLPHQVGPELGLPYPYQGQMRPPSEPVPAIHSMNTLGMAPNLPGFHSNVTMMMPTMSEAEARARLAGLPTTDASALAIQSAGPFNFATPFADIDDEIYEEDDDQSDEINVMAVIIFGTLSVTALGGFGMLILLIFTAPTL